jgi:DNA-binding transcriptional ArsR family regulator
MLANGAAFKLVDALLEVGSEGATREHLLRKAKISVRTFYKHLKELLEAGVVQEFGNRYRISLELAYVFRYKKWRDLDVLYDREETVRNAVLNIRSDALSLDGDNILCLWLVGSAARGEMKKESDLDFLAIVRSHSDYEPKEGSFKVQWVTMKRTEFTQKLREGDEFAVSALRQGLIIHDKGVAQKLYLSPINKPSDSSLRERESVVERFRKKLFEHLEFEEFEEAEKVLCSLTEIALRSILQYLGENPRGKSHILSLAELYFGKEINEDLAIATFLEVTQSKDAIIALHRKISSYYERFLARAEHLAFVARSLLSGHPVEFEKALRIVFSELFSDASIKGENIEILAYEMGHMLVQGKTLTGVPTQESLEPIVKMLSDQRPSLIGLVVVNPLREVPIYERDFERLENGIQDLTPWPTVSAITSIRLLQIYLDFHLLGWNQENYVLDLLLLNGVKRSELEELVKRSLSSLKVNLLEWEHEDDTVDNNPRVVYINLSDLDFADDYNRNDGNQAFRIEFEYSATLELNFIVHNVRGWADYAELKVVPGPTKGSIRPEITKTASAVLTHPGTRFAQITDLEIGITQLSFQRRELEDEIMIQMAEGADILELQALSQEGVQFPEGPDSWTLHLASEGREE